MKVRTAAGVKTVSAIHIRTSTGLKTVSAGHLRTAAGLKDIFVLGSGGSEGVTISPTAKTTTSTSSRSNTSDFTATFTGGTPTSITWTLTNKVNCTATLISGQGTATGRVSLTVSGTAVPATGSCDVTCTAVINGVTVSATATKQHTINSSGGGGATYTPAAGTYSDEGTPSASFTINASVSVSWTWHVITGSTPSSNVASGGTANHITLSLSAGSVDKSSNISVSSGGKTWTIGLVAHSLGGA